MALAGPHLPCIECERQEDDTRTGVAAFTGSFLAAGMPELKDEPVKYYPIYLVAEGRACAVSVARMRDQETWQNSISPELRALCVNGRPAETTLFMPTKLGRPDLSREEAAVNG